MEVWTMRHCDGALFDGSACPSAVYECSECGVVGCAGDGCENQKFLGSGCDACGHDLRPLARVA